MVFIHMIYREVLLNGLSLVPASHHCDGENYSPGILGFEMEKNNIKLKISGSVYYVLLYYL